MKNAAIALLFVFGCIAALSPANAEEDGMGMSSPLGQNFQLQAQLYYETTQFDDAADTERTLYGIGASASLDTVSYDNRPITEARWLARVPWAALEFASVQQEDNLDDEGGTGYGATLRWSDPEVPLDLHISYFGANLDESVANLEETLSVLEVKAGYWADPLAEDLQLGFRYRSEDREFALGDLTTNAIGVYGELLFPLNRHSWVKGVAALEQVDYENGESDENYSFEFGADYYFTPLYGAGVLFDMEVGGFDATEGLRTELHVNADAQISGYLFGLRAYYEIFLPSDDDGIDEDTFGVQLIGRF